jgi:hypothetical protein
VSLESVNLYDIAQASDETGADFGAKSISSSTLRRRAASLGCELVIDISRAMLILIARHVHVLVVVSVI